MVRHLDGDDEIVAWSEPYGHDFRAWWRDCYAIGMLYRAAWGCAPADQAHTIMMLDAVAGVVKATYAETASVLNNEVVQDVVNRAKLVREGVADANGIKEMLAIGMRETLRARQSLVMYGADLDFDRNPAQVFVEATAILVAMATGQVFCTCGADHTGVIQSLLEQALAYASALRCKHGIETGRCPPGQGWKPLQRWANERASELFRQHVPVELVELEANLFHIGTDPVTGKRIPRTRGQA